MMLLSDMLLCDMRIREAGDDGSSFDFFSSEP